MKTRLFFPLGLVVLLMGCSKPSYVGVKKEFKAPVNVQAELKKESNLEVHQRFISDIRLPASIVDELLKEPLVIVANYSQYPFDGSKDSSQSGANIQIDNFLLTELGVTFNKQLLNKGVRLLENESNYNRIILYNFDKATVHLNFEVLDYGLFYEQIAYDKIIRHIKASIRYRIITNKGLLRSIEDKPYTLSDTIGVDDISDIERKRVTLGYPDAHFGKRLTTVGAPSKSGDKIERINNFGQDSTISAESITALKFEVPITDKSYVLYVLDYYDYDSLRSKKEPTIEDIRNLKPLALPLTYSQYEKLLIRGVFTEVPVGYISIDAFSEMFNKTKKLVILNSSAKQMVTVNMKEDGTIVVD